MRFFYWVVFGIFLATSLAFNLNEVAAAEKYDYTMAAGHLWLNVDIPIE